MRILASYFSLKNQNQQLLVQYFYEKYLVKGMLNFTHHISAFFFPMQVEMFLLAYALQYTIQVYRLYKYSTDEFITLYPNDPQEDWPVVTLITEDDRHYNIPVRMCQETVL